MTIDEKVKQLEEFKEKMKGLVEFTIFEYSKLVAIKKGSGISQYEQICLEAVLWSLLAELQREKK